MPLERFRDISEMNAPQIESDPEKILQKIEFVWSMASIIASEEPRGLQKFQSIQEANTARQEYIRARARRLQSAESQHVIHPSAGPRRTPETEKGLILHLSDDFDEPLEDFADYS